MHSWEKCDTVTVHYLPAANRYISCIYRVLKCVSTMKLTCYACSYVKSILDSFRQQTTSHPPLCLHFSPQSQLRVLYGAGCSRNVSAQAMSYSSALTLGVISVGSVSCKMYDRAPFDWHESIVFIALPPFKRLHGPALVRVRNFICSLLWGSTATFYTQTRANFRTITKRLNAKCVQVLRS